MRVSKSIRLKVIVIFLLIGVLPMSGSALYLYENSSENIDTMAFNLLSRVIIRANGTIENTLEQVSRVLLLSSHNPAFVQYFNEPDRKNLWGKEIERALIEIEALFPDHVHKADLIGMNGQELIKVVDRHRVAIPKLDSDESHHELFQAGLALSREQVFQGEPHLAKDIHQWVIPFVVPIVLPDGRKAALLHIDLNLSYLEEILKEGLDSLRWLGEGGEIFILDDQGYFLAHTRIPINGGQEGKLQSALEGQASPLWSRVVQEMTQGKIESEKGVLKDHLSYIHFQPIFRGENNGQIWSTGIVIPVHMVQKAIHPPNYWAIVVLGGPIVMLMALWFGTGLTAPILSLTRATSAMASGDLKARVHIRNADEIGRLGQSFNHMAERLESSYQAVAKKSGQLQTLYDAATALSSITTSPDIIMKVLLEISRTATHSRYGALSLLDDAGKAVQFFHVGLTPEQEDLLKTPPQGHGLLGAMHREGRPIRLDNLSEDPRSLGFPVGHVPMKTFVGVPLKARGKILGSLYLTEKENGQPFTEEDEALVVMIARDASMAFENARLHEEASRQAKVDSLTGLYNRRFFDERLHEEFHRSQRYRRPFSLIIMDLDLLKQINDRYGHVAGDRAIKTLGDVLMENIRTNDIAARYGGDEFVVLLPETDTAGSVNMARRLQQKLADTALILESGSSLQLGVSVGTATYPQDALQIDDLIKTADHSLYLDKAGRRSAQ